MQFMILWAAAWFTVLVAQTGVQPSDRYRDEFKLRPETAQLSNAFSMDAWIILLYTSRQGSAETEQSHGDPVDVALESLRSKVKTDGEWLFWYRLNSYSIAKQLSGMPQASSSLTTVENPQACRDALMVANRSHTMIASMPACELAPQKTAGRKP